MALLKLNMFEPEPAIFYHQKVLTKQNNYEPFLYLIVAALQIALHRAWRDAIGIDLRRQRSEAGLWFLGQSVPAVPAGQNTP